jgi:AAA ATPase-like protein
MASQAATRSEQLLLEREGEIEALRDVLARAAAGTGGLAVIDGAAGVGKTALVEAACRRAADMGREIFRARGSGLEAGFAFGVVRQLFERRLLGVGESEREELLARHDRRNALRIPTLGSGPKVKPGCSYSRGGRTGGGRLAGQHAPA